MFCRRYFGFFRGRGSGRLANLLYHSEGKALRQAALHETESPSGSLRKGFHLLGHSGLDGLQYCVKVRLGDQQADFHL